MKLPKIMCFTLITGALVLHNLTAEEKQVSSIQERIAQATEMIEKNPQDPFTYFGRGTLYFLVKDFEKAVTDFNMAIGLQPTSMFYTNRGLVYFYMGKDTAALADLTTAIALDSTDAWAFYNRGLVYHRMDDYKSSLKDYLHAIELGREDPEIYYAKAVVLYHLDKYGEALSDINKAIEKKERGVFYAIKAVILYTMGKKKEAKLNYKKANELDKVWGGNFKELQVRYSFKPKIIAVLRNLCASLGIEIKE